MDYIAMTTFMANGKQIKRGTVLKAKDVAKWMNLPMLEAGGYLRRIESSE
jgi:hypothetical protein